MNKYKLTPVITLTREDAQIEAINDLIAQLLKDPTVGSEMKMAIYEDLFSRVRSYKQVPRHEQEPQMMVRESRTTQTPKKAIRRKEYEVADVPSQTENRSANTFAQTDSRTADSFTAFDQGDFGPLDYSPVIHEVFNRNSPRSARNVVVTSSQASPTVNSVVPPNRRSAISPNTQTAISPNTRTAISPNTHTALSPSSRTAVSPDTRTAIAPIRATPRRSETTTQFFDRLSKGGRRQPTRDSPQKTRQFTATQGGNGFISKKRWAFP